MEWRGKTILLVEDDPNDVLLFKRALNKAGIGVDVQIARDGDEAISYLSGNGSFVDRNQFPFPQFIIMDLKLPRRNGLELLEWLKQDPRCNVIPAIILSSSKQPVDVQRAYRLGAACFISKPAAFEELQNVISYLFRYWSLCERPLVPRA